LHGSIKERDHSEYLDENRKIILKLIFVQCDGVIWAGFIWLRIETNSGSL
jgi:hypothetical protein